MTQPAWNADPKCCECDMHKKLMVRVVDCVAHDGRVAGGNWIEAHDESRGEVICPGCLFDLGRKAAQ